MSWSAPKTMGAEAAVSSDWNTYVRDNLNYLKGIGDGVAFSGTQITRAAATSIATATWTAITWTAEAFDYGGWWASGTNIVIPAGAIPSGYTTIMVMVTATATFASNGTGYRMLRALKNGSQFGRDRISAISGDQTDIGFTEFTTAVSGDIITFELYQNSGGGLNASAMLANVVRFAPVV